MASYDQAASMRDAVYDLLTNQFKLRPKSIGVMPLGDRAFAVRVTLPRQATTALPDTVDGIPVRYDFQHEPAVLAGGSPMNWHEKALGRRR
jgi:hypothetical protein